MPKLKYPEKVYLLLSQLYLANQGPTAAQRFIQENEGIEIPITTISSIYRRFKKILNNYGDKTSHGQPIGKMLLMFSVFTEWHNLNN
mgnify:CR=1 FL=1